MTGSRETTRASDDQHRLVSGGPPEPMIEVVDLVKHYRAGHGVVRAVDGVSFRVARGETLGVVGESGCGKSTTAKLLVRLEEPTAGEIRLAGEEISRLRGRRLRALRRRIQLVFQDPDASLNPRLTAADALTEVLAVHRLADGAGGRARVGELLEMVGLPASAGGRYPHQMSGGQRQRVGIARALAVSPEVLVLDEPVSALDVSVRAEVINLLARLRDELALTYVFISHDLGMVRHLSDRIAVMYLGRLAELGDWRAVSDAPLHPYTRSLQEAVPAADPEAESRREAVPLRGEPPDPSAPPPGCRFHTRCPLAEQLCREESPALMELRPGQFVACHVAAREAARRGDA
ncbi:MAG: ATP-binding cassette domain-containing protein [Micromonosporaceae bacterium]|nr:ATP-binding cassette domain-containing protein [Micromonosporaceae bacterium]